MEAVLLNGEFFLDYSAIRVFLIQNSEIIWKNMQKKLLIVAG
jgi:hypothetical protein